MKFFLNFLNCIKMIMRLKKLFYNFVKILLVCTACTHSFPFAPLNAWINFWTVTHFQIQTRLILAPKNPIWFSYKYQKGEKMLFGNLHRSLNNEYYEIIFEWMNKLKRGSYWMVCVLLDILKTMKILSNKTQRKLILCIDIQEVRQCF